MRLAILAAVVTLSGCVPVPMNPTEFRAAVNTERRNIDKFEVNRPFADVTRTFQKMTPECLNYSVSTTEKRGLIGGADDFGYLGVGQGNPVSLPDKNGAAYPEKDQGSGWHVPRRRNVLSGGRCPSRWRWQNQNGNLLLGRCGSCSAGDEGVGFRWGDGLPRSGPTILTVNIGGQTAVS